MIGLLELMIRKDDWFAELTTSALALRGCARKFLWIFGVLKPILMLPRVIIISSSFEKPLIR